MSRIGIFDIEANGLKPSKIHCLVASIYSEGEWRPKSTTKKEDMIRFFERTDIIVGHNITRWDIPVLERLLDIKIKCKVRDTLALSWYLYPDRPTHGLADWGEFFGVPKPKIDNWEDLPTEEYINRCQEDVRINTLLWEKIWKDLLNLYDGDLEAIESFLSYINFKMDCAREAERSGWRLNVKLCFESLEKLEALKEERINQLIAAMPDTIKTKIVSRPETLYTKDKVYTKPLKYLKGDGTLSSVGKKFSEICKSQGLDPDKVEEAIVPSTTLSSKGLTWLNLLEERGLSEDHIEDLEIETSRDIANPNSHTQVKSWLTGLGWKPITFDIKPDRKVPQVRVEINGEKMLCESVKRLIVKEPAIEALEGLTILSHRIGILNGYLSNVDEDGFLTASIQGLTNTLRFKHKVIVNLPSVNKPYGDIVRGCLMASKPENECVGSDMSSLEDRTKQHFMWKHDPEYVKEMMTPDFDPHLALAQFAGALTAEQVQSHKDKGKYKKAMGKAKEIGDLKDFGKFKILYEQEQDFSVTRHQYKTANYSCTYGAGGDALSAALDIPKSEGHAIVNAYREKNWALNAIAKECKIKTCMGTMWLFNPVSKFWYSLRHKKDTFSTLNQGTGVYCFDTWIAYFRAKRPQLTGQMHDEVILDVPKGQQEEITKLLKDAIAKTNKKLKLNRDLDVDVQFGDNYAEIH